MPSAWSTSSPKHVGHRLVDRPGLVPVDEAGGVLGDAVGQLVRDHVVGRGVARAVDHLVAGPERVVQRAGARRAVVGGGAQLAAVAEVGADQRGEVDAERAGVPVRGGAAEVVGLVGVGDAGRRTALDPVVQPRLGTGRSRSAGRRRRRGPARRPRPAAAPPDRTGRRRGPGRRRRAGSASAPAPARPHEAPVSRTARPATGPAASGSAGRPPASTRARRAGRPRRGARCGRRSRPPRCTPVPGRPRARSRRTPTAARPGRRGP